ncbi:nucleotidyltransferase [Mycoplasma phocoenae]|uniref:Nucleotidyltransferase n=1 Tax=Mycoplasma phocoenae TaxID=754517 RepID=A0A858U7R7_9MOLU|nr:nucleotidyltransferase [Mycoplasma phocoenae]QJG66818.1 nucleotidyltransferase [Mycoplasma phocoenae]
MSVAIVAEYNPFHNGHIYQLEQAKQKFPNEKIYIILTDDFTQRGDFNTMSFESRKQFALQYGADAVIKMSLHASTQAAHIFAQEAIELIHQNQIDKIFFGSETDNINLFIQAATAIKNNLDEYNKIVKKWLKQGFSFVKSSAEALKELIGSDFSQPNDILGFEYVKQIVFNNYDIQPFCLKRTLPFHSEEVIEKFASATKLRKMIENNEDISMYSPVQFVTAPDSLKNHWHELKNIILNTEASELAQIHMVSEGMENLFKKHTESDTMEEFIDKCTSRRYTKNRIQRTLLSIYLNKR